jgi:hypothetical protein
MNAVIQHERVGGELRPRGDRSRYVQYGAGTSGPASWRNFDVSPTLRLQRIPLAGKLLQRTLLSSRPVFPETIEYGDIVRGLPIVGGSCRAIYCSHVLEHLALADCRRALRNTYDYLEPGGVFRMVLPDLRSLAAAYLAHGGADGAHLFMERSCLGVGTRSLGARLAAALGNSGHLWMWDFPAMSVELERQGFVDIREAAHGDSDEARFADVEEADRWTESGMTAGSVIRCLAIECRKATPMAAEDRSARLQESA